jgi:glycosyltransferase involved in cell wall biosynthesis
MKILILNWRDIKHPLAGGAEISLLEHAKYWERMKNEVVWFSSTFTGAKNKEVIDGIRYIRKGSAYTVHFWAFIYYIKGKIDEPDIIIDNFHFIPFFTPLYVENKKVIGLINEVAGKLWFENLPYVFARVGYYLEPLFFRVYESCPFIVASKSTYIDLQKMGISKESIRVIHNGLTKLDTKKNIVKEKKPTILFLGRISKDKGISDALSAFNIIKKEIKDIQFWIIGKEEREGLLDHLLSIEKLKISKKQIHYFGFIKEEKKFELLKRAHILVHPSLKEGWGLTVIEAASQGTPTIGYNVEGLRDSIVDGQTGILTSTTPQSLAQNLIKLLENKNLYKKMSINAVEWSKKFTWSKSTKQSWEMLKQVKDTL